MAAEEPQWTGFPFNELVADCVDLILTDFLDLPTLMSYGYTCKAAVSQVMKALSTRHALYKLQRFLNYVAKLGYIELLKFFIIEISPFRVRGRPLQNESHDMIEVITTAVQRGHVEFVRKLMAIRDGAFVGFFCGERMSLSASCFYEPHFFLQQAIDCCNSPAMYDFFREVKAQLDVKEICKSCIGKHQVELLRHVFSRLDARTSFDLLCEVPEWTVSAGVIDILEIFMKEMKMIRVDGNRFVVTFEGQNREIPFETAWLKKNLMEVVTCLERFGIQIAFSHCIGYSLLYDSNPDFLVYLEQKGIDYRDLVGQNDFKSLFYGERVQINHGRQVTFYDRVFRDRGNLGKLTRDLTEGLIIFIGGLVWKDPAVFLPLVRSIYDQAPHLHTLFHPFYVMVNSSKQPTEQVMRFLLEFSWTSQIDSDYFFKKIRESNSIKPSIRRNLIFDFIALRRRDESHLSGGILYHLVPASVFSLKDLHEILLVMPPLTSGVSFYSVSAFFDLHCQSAREIGSFAAIVEWMKSHLMEEMRWTDAIAMKYIAKCHEKVLPRLFDLGLPMPSKSALAVLCANKVNEPRRPFPYRSEMAIKIEELALLGSILEKLRVLKQRGADFSESLLCDAFDFTASESAVGLASLFRHSEQVKCIFDFLIDDCGCPLHSNVLLAAIEIVGKESICLDGTIKTLDYLITRQCPFSRKCIRAAVSCDLSRGDSFVEDLLVSIVRRNTCT